MRVTIDGEEVPAGANLGDALSAAMAWAWDNGRAVSQVRVDGKVLKQAQIDRMAARSPALVEFATRDRREWAADILGEYFVMLQRLETMAPTPEAHEAWCHAVEGVRINVLSLLRLDLRKLELPDGRRGWKVYETISDALIDSKQALDRGDGAGSSRILTELRRSIPDWRQALEAIKSRAAT